MQKFLVTVLCLFSLGYCAEPAYAAATEPISCKAVSSTLKCQFRGKFNHQYVTTTVGNSVYADTSYEHYFPSVARRTYSQYSYKSDDVRITCTEYGTTRRCDMWIAYKFDKYVIETAFTRTRVWDYK